MSDFNSSFSNPLAPPGHVANDNEKPNLTNEDFRKLVMTVGRDPKATSSVAAAMSSKEKRSSNDHDKKKKKKQQYLKFKRDKEDRERELNSKYRDRARERRDGNNQDYEDVELLQATAEYRAVAPDAKRQEELKERRKKAIDESKYLGGDMQHTHLVKGLDFALLDKVRQEMLITKHQEEQELEQQRQKEQQLSQGKKESEDSNTISSIIARNIIRNIFAKETSEHLAAIREHFSKHRMAYVVELEEDPNAETDIPTTVIRSVAEAGYSVSANGSRSSSEIVVEKLTDILSYLRSGKSRKVPKKAEPPVSTNRFSQFSASKSQNKSGNFDKIYDDVGDYVPPVGKSKKDEASSSKKSGSYFGSIGMEADFDDKHPQTIGEIMKGFQKDGEDNDDTQADVIGKGGVPGSRMMKKLEQKMMVDSYAECYPGMMESMDALADSDEEADISKMDMGVKKGPLKRWDFETAEEYEEYKSSQEALPKAAFQYGVKGNDGRKTRRIEGKKDEKAAADREWKKIQQIWDRKRDSTGGEEGKDDKRPRY